MINTYLKTSIRTARRHPFFTSINIIALALSMSVCLIVLTIIKNQFDYDAYNPDCKFIYRIGTKVSTLDNTIDKYATSPVPLANKLKNSYGFITATANIRPIYSAVLVFNHRSLIANGAFTSRSAFGMFHFQFSPESDISSFGSPHKMIINSGLAAKIFHDKNPVGNVVEIDSLGSFQIVGVFNEKAQKSHVQNDFYISEASIASLEKLHKIMPVSEAWNNYASNYTYVQLNTDDRSKIVSAVENISSEYKQLIKYNANEKSYDFFSQPLRDITPTRGYILENSRGLSYTSIGIFTGVVLILLLIAAFNYSSLTIARALTRSKEIGTRKLLGATRVDIFIQFIIEGTMISIASSLMALLLIPFIPLNESIQNLFYSVKIDAALICYFGIFSVATGCIAGFVPGLIFSRYKVIDIIKNVLDTRLFTGAVLKKGLIVVQFSFSAVFLLLIIVLYRQSRFMATADYGFTTKDIINVKLANNMVKKTIENEFKSIPGVLNVSSVSGAFGIDPPKTMKVRNDKNKTSMNIDFYSIDRAAITNLQLRLTAGQNFASYAGDRSTDEVIVNEKALTALNLGTSATAVGKHIYMDDTVLLRIVGVAKDFNYQNYKSPITPLLLINNPVLYNYLNVKVESNSMAKVVPAMRSLWVKLYPNIEFQYWDYDKSFRSQQGHNADVLMLTSISGIFLSISILGLLGMAAFHVETKIKETNIRKILGATPWDVMKLLSFDFLKLLLVATLLGVPVGYLLGQSFLNGFSYRVGIGIGTVSLTVLIMIFLGVLTLCSQTLKSAVSSPLNRIKSE